MTTASAVRVASIAAGVLAAAGVLLAQQGARFRSSIDTVEVHVTVRAADGALTKDLTKDDFELYDNGRRREITVFSADVQPITMTLLLDTSGSVGRKIPQVVAAATTFVGALLPADRAAIDTLTWECERFTSDKTRLTSRLESLLTVHDPASAVWGGLNRTLSTLGRESGRRAVLLFSDGDDGGSPNNLRLPDQDGCQWAADRSLVTLDDVVRRAEREGVMVYTVSIENFGGTTRDGDLRRIARESGGERYRLEREAELTAAFTRIVDELHHQYLLGFVPDVFDDKRHDLDVRVKRRGLTARARKSYVATRIDPATAAASAPRLAALSDDEVAAAIAAGVAGQRLQAECAASILVPDNATETDTILTIVAEGPAGRIMRLAREARQAKRAFTVADVTAAWRAPTVEITAQTGTRVTPPPVLPDQTAAAPPPKPPPVLSPLMTMRVRSKEMTGATIEPIDPPAAPPRSPFFRPPSRTRLSSTFDLAAFRALPGDVEVVVQSRVIRRCTISARDKTAIR